MNYKKASLPFWKASVYIYLESDTYLIASKKVENSVPLHITKDYFYIVDGTSTWNEPVRRRNKDEGNFQEE